MWETSVQSLGQEDPLGKGMATYSSILAWEILPGTEDPGGLQSLGLTKVRHNRATNTFTLSTLLVRYPCSISLSLSQQTLFCAFKYICVCALFTCPVWHLNVIETRLTPLSILAICNLAVVSNSMEESVITLKTFHVKTQEIHLRLFISDKHPFLGLE